MAERDDNNTPNDDSIIDDDQNGVSNAGDNGNDDGQQAAAADDDPDFATMTPRERALVDKARSQEKRKLQKDLQTTKDRLRTAERQLREVQNRPTPRTPTEAREQNTEIAELRDLVGTLVTNLNTMQENQERNTRLAELRAYRNERIAELRRDGEDVVEALVGGDNEDEIDASIDVARAEYKFIAIKEEEKRKRNGNGRVNPATVNVGAHRGRAAGTPSSATTGSVSTDKNITESIPELTSDDAIRNGAYEKNRTQLLSSLKRNFRYVGNAHR